MQLMEIISDCLAKFSDINLVEDYSLKIYRGISILLFIIRNFKGKKDDSNVLLFIPYGFFACYYIDLKSFFKAFGLVFVASLSIEFTQLMIGRVFDVDDILLNVVGGMIGYAIYNVLRKIVTKFKFLKKEMVLNIITVLILFLGLLVLAWR